MGPAAGSRSESPGATNKEQQMQWYAVMCGGVSGMHDGWGVLSEFKAVARMGNEGYEAFCPTLSRLHRPRRGERLREMRNVPMWDGYVFARLDARALNDRLPRWPEVFDVVRRGGDPEPLTEAQIDAVQQLEHAFRFTVIRGRPIDMVRKILTGRLIAASKQILSVGDVVEHRGASFEHLRGTIARIDRDNLEILVGLLFGAERKIKVKARDVVLVPA